MTLIMLILPKTIISTFKRLTWLFGNDKTDILSEISNLGSEGIVSP